MSPTDSDIAEITDAQIEAQGVASYRVSDGQVFVFTAKLLRSLLEAAEGNESGRAILFVRSGAVA